jgi:hypothetical protein
MKGISQLQEGKNWILPKEKRSMETGSSGTFIGWKSGKKHLCPSMGSNERELGYGLCILSIQY